MLTLVSGGAASGKSEYAESLLSDTTHEKIYIATMQPFGKDSAVKIARHHALRAGKGFQTLERYRNLEELEVPENCAVLLECMSNLVANECFSEAGFDNAVQRILRGIEHISKSTAEFVVVTNEIFSDGETYDRETAEYIEVLAGVNKELASCADRVIEVVCGIPINWKEAV